MGATCAAAWIIGHRLYAATVGDSRLYLLRGRAIIQLSTDHTWIQEALERGFIQPEEARGHPNAHVIRRYLGSPSPPRVDIRLRLSSRESDTQSEANQGLLLQAGDQLILCSDGLTDLVENREILNAFTSQPAQKAAEAMVNLANARGGHDNITLVAIDVPATPAAGVVPAGRRSGRRGCAIVARAAAGRSDCGRVLVLAQYRYSGRQPYRSGSYLQRSLKRPEAQPLQRQPPPRLGRPHPHPRSSAARFQAPRQRAPTWRPVN